MASRAVVYGLLTGLVVSVVGYSPQSAVAAPATTAAAKPATAEKRVALIIGNGAYKLLAPLPQPPVNAQLVSDALVGTGFSIIGGKPLVNADHQAIENAIRQFGQAVRGGAVGLFYYSGYAVQVKGVNYLVPAAANVNGDADIKYELVDLSLVIDEIANAGNPLNFVILDSSLNKPFGPNVLKAGAVGLAQIAAPANTVVSYAAQPNAVAANVAGNTSAYSKSLVEAMRVPGASVQQVFTSVADKVKKATSGKQQPWLATAPLKVAFNFTAPPKPVPPPVPAAAAAPVAPAAAPANDAVELTFWNSVKDKKNVEMFQAYLKEYPNGKFATLAKIEIKTLQAKPAPAPVPAPAPAVAPPPRSASTPAPAPSYQPAAAPTPAARTTPAARPAPVIVAPRTDPSRPNKTEYPDEAARRGITGTVGLELLVNESGAVVEVRVAKSSGSDVLDNGVSQQALKNWRYLPGTYEGVPSTMWTKANVSFK